MKKKEIKKIDEIIFGSTLGKMFLFGAKEEWETVEGWKEEVENEGYEPWRGGFGEYLKEFAEFELSSILDTKKKIDEYLTAKAQENEDLGYVMFRSIVFEYLYDKAWYVNDEGKKPQLLKELEDKEYVELIMERYTKAKTVLDKRW